VKDKGRTAVEKDTIANVSSVSTAVEVQVSPDAAIRVTPAGQSPGVDRIASGEMIVTGDDSKAILKMAKAKAAEGKHVNFELGSAEPGGSTGGVLKDGKITIFKGSATLATRSEGRTVDQIVLDTFIHESRHFFGGVFNTEAQVQGALRGTPSQ
jgi:hypothetical protein